MQNIPFDKIWEARKLGFTNEEASRGFYIDEMGGIRRIVITDAYESDLEASYYAVETYGLKVIDIYNDYPYLVFLYDLMSTKYIDNKTNRKILEQLNIEVQETLEDFIESYYLSF